MKKLISVASSLAMAATMVCTAVPFATGAADASASFELRPYLNQDGTAASTTISADDLAKGDVTIPVGVYMVKGAADVTSMGLQVSTSGDPKYVTFGYLNDKGEMASYGPGAEYFSSAINQIGSDGAEVSTNMLVGPLCSLTKGRRGAELETKGNGASSVDKGYAEAGVTNDWASYTWAGTIDSWTSSKSDDYPLCVIPVNFAKGTPAGTYTIDFVNYPSPNNPDNYSCYIDCMNSGATYTTKRNNLTLESLTITVEGDAPVTTTTTGESQVTTTAVTTTGDITTTTTPVELGDYNIIFPNDSIDKLIAEGDDLHIESTSSGYTYYMDVKFDIPDNDLVAAVKVTPGSMSTPSGVTYAGYEKTQYATTVNKTWDKSGEYLYLYPLTSGGDATSLKEEEAIITLKFDIDKDFEGKVPVTFDEVVFVTKDGTANVENKATIVAGSFTKGAAVTTTTTGEVTTTTTAEVTTTTTAEVTTTSTAKVTTTSTTAEPGTLLYGDTNCNGTVNIADVVVLNKWLNDASAYAMTDQGKINADCCDPKEGAGLNASDSKAIIQSIVHLVELPTTADKLK